MDASLTLLAGRYHLGKSLGVGGMGRVWLAYDQTLGREVAIKEIVLPAELTTERDAVQDRTLREARAVARLSHPNVVQIYDVVEADGRPWIVMEYVPSRSLEQVIRHDGPLEPQRVAEIGLAVLAALESAQRTGVQHRDIKPANVLLADDGRVVLTDFGIATVEGDGFVTRSGVVLGSPEYISPERARDGTGGLTSDLWSLGATLYSAVQGRSPYKRESPVATLAALASEEPDPPDRAGAMAPVLAGLLRRSPDSRTGLAETRRRLMVAAGQVEAPARRSLPRISLPRIPVPSLSLPRISLPRLAVRRPALKRPVVLAVAAVTLVAAAVVALLVVRPDTRSAGWRASGTAVGPASGQPSAQASAQASAPSGTGATGSADPGSGGTDTPTSIPERVPPPNQNSAARRPDLPPGWRDHRDPTGFSVYVPAGWSQSKEGSIVYFRDPASGRVLGIDQTDRPKADPVQDWREQSSYRVRRGDFPGYREVHIVAVRYWLKAADWEFTFNGNVRQHVNNRGFVVSPTKAYGIYWQTSDSDWAAAYRDLQLVFDSFRPVER